MLTTPDIENTNVTSFGRMPTPSELHAKLPLSERAFATVMSGRAALRDILDRKDKRLFVVVGPCSIHDPEAGLDYARRLKALQDEVADTMLLVMRVYFEKPRTVMGWGSSPSARARISPGVSVVRALCRRKNPHATSA